MEYVLRSDSQGTTNSTEHNKGFLKYKNIHNGDTGILFAPGPSVKKYKPIFDDTKSINVGLSWIFNQEDILDKLNYYFFGSGYHYVAGTYDESPEVDDYRNKINSINPSIQKFASVYRQGTPTGLGNITPESCENINAIPFDCQSPHGYQDFITDIDEQRIFGLSIIFPALQFMLYTGLSKIYLVGVDANIGSLSSTWIQAKNFIQSSYPSVEIISINPVGLKGYFKDEYTE